MSECEVCFRHCKLEEGQKGFCGSRICKDGIVQAANYGRITAMALDPIEKKPLRRFHPGSKILSIGSYGCNLRCPFCQNHEISWSPEVRKLARQSEYLSPREIAQTAELYVKEGNIGVAYTYNEPLISYEFVRDTARLVKKNGMVNVLVTNGTAELSVLEELAPYIDAMNIDLKGFTKRYYEDVLDGNLDMVKEFIIQAVKTCHVELTTLIVPGENDSVEEMRELTEFVTSLRNAKGETIGAGIPLHVSRFFPQFHMTDRAATDVKNVYRLAEVAGERLKYVYTGNC